MEKRWWIWAFPRHDIHTMHRSMAPIPININDFLPTPYKSFGDGTSSAAQIEHVHLFDKPENSQQDTHNKKQAQKHDHKHKPRNMITKRIGDCNGSNGSLQLPFLRKKLQDKQAQTHNNAMFNVVVRRALIYRVPGPRAVPMCSSHFTVQ